MSHNYWPLCGYTFLETNAAGHLVVTDDFLRFLLERPELAPMETSCVAEIHLHQHLLESPRSDIKPDQLATLQDVDARANYAVWMRFRQRILAHPTLEASYLALFQGDGVDVPPLLVHHISQILLRHILKDDATALQVRIAEMFFRTQKITILEDGVVMAADEETVERLATQSSFGTLGDLLQKGGIKLKSVDLDVLQTESADGYWSRSENFDWAVQLNHGQPGLDALCTVMARWIEHFLGVTVRVQTEKDMDDDQWVWHVGLDAQASGVLNALYQGQEVESDKMERMLCLFSLHFLKPNDMSAHVRGKPVYLAMAMDAEKRLKLKPQNLLLNLPLAKRS
jgi:hypothetical protein